MKAFDPRERLIPSKVTSAPGAASRLVLRITAENGSAFTLAGTNTYLVGRNPCFIVDPGPNDPCHLALIVEQADERGGIGAVLLTHSHADHSEGVEALGVEVVRPEDGAQVGPLTAIATPGHADDHFVFLSEDGVCFSGDLILGTGSSFVPPDGGSLAAYMCSLARLRELAPSLICPGHGPWVTDPIAKIDEYIEHREARERGLVRAIGRGERSRTVLLGEVWSDVPEGLRPAAALVMEAHIEKLIAEGRIDANFDE